jgi:hypothetical protein
MNSNRTGWLVRRPAFAAIAVVIVGLSATACGTTVRDARSVLAQRANEGLDGVVGGSSTAPAPATSTSTSPDGTAGAPIPTTGPVTAQPSATGPASSGVPSTGTSGQPTTPGGASSSATPTPHHSVPTGPAKLSPVEIGIIYSPDLGAFAKLFGATADVGDLQTEANAVISYINKHGGLDEHVLSPVYYSLSLTSTAPYSTTMAAICSSWTQDHHVAAGIAVGFSIPNDLAACLSAHHIPYLSGGNYLHDQATYASIPYLVSPYEAGTDEVMPALLKELLARHELTSKSKVGVLLGSNETAATDAYNNVIVPMLKGKVASVTSYDIAFPPSTTAAVAEAQTTSNDELHMRANGVTNVLFLAPGAEGSLIQDAYQQHWFPKYAITSFDTPWALASAHTKEIGAALAGAIGIGWQPTMDVGTYGSSVFTNPTTRTCKAIEAPTGQLTNNEHEFAAYQYCDGLLSVQAAANASGAATITGSSLLAGYNALGTSHPDAIAMGERLDAQHHNGAGAYRPLAFNTGCRCFQYTGNVTDF